MSFEMNPILTPSQKSRLQDLLDLQKNKEDGMTLPEMEGFFFGLAINPSRLIMPSTWLPLILDDENIVFKTRKQAEEMVPILLEAYNAYVEAENDKTLAFPFDMKKLDENVLGDLMDWCKGFHRTITIRPSAWGIRGMDIPKDPSELLKSPAFFLCIILAVNDKKVRKGLYPVGEGDAKISDADALGLVIRRIPEAVAKLQGYSRELRRKEREQGFELPPDSSLVTIGGKTGRNELCPCGSGKKFKKCCGSGQTIH